VSTVAPAGPQVKARTSPSVIVVGAGFGGITAAIELREHGIEDITILEKGPGLGGTWRYNSYPGAACDVPSHLYSYSFAQRRDWSRLCSPQTEILTYLTNVATDRGVDRLITPNRTVTSCAWDEDRCRWSVHTAEGETYESDALILATGQLHQPSFPRIEGADTFAGHTFHSAQWDHDYPLAGKRVAVVGTGASAVQFVPEIVDEVKRLTVFQRTGNWFMPRKNRPYPRPFRAAIERMPRAQAFRRQFWVHFGELLTFSIRHPETVGRLIKVRSAAFMRFQLRDPELRAKVWPDYTFGCKRILFSSHFLPALARPNVDLVTDAITGICAEGVVTADASVHEVDCIIWGTGFKTNDFMFPMDVTGTDGGELSEAWAQGAHAHLGIVVAGFPNMFVMYGPNTNTSGGSIITYLEAQAGYVRQALAQLRARRAGAIDVRPEIESASDRAVQARFAGTAWTQCDSWYRDDSGRIVANWPGYMREYVQQTQRLDPAEYTFSPRPVRAATPA